MTKVIYMKGYSMKHYKSSRISSKDLLDTIQQLKLLNTIQKSNIIRHIGLLRDSNNYNDKYDTYTDKQKNKVK